jgi:formate hydrogenlyase subunit 3/multisubunit Na+/H+ antiporter MnhD subunit
MEEHEEPQAPANDQIPADGIVKYARPALIAAAAVVVISLALLAVIFALDTFNATVYSVGGKNINDASDEARDIRELYSAVRVGGVVVLVASAVTAIAAAIVLFRSRNSLQNREDNGENLGFNDLADS